MANIKKKIEKKEDKVETFNFIWEGKDQKGRDISGEVRAVSEVVVRVALRAKNINVKKIKKQSFASAKKIKSSDISIFTRQLSTMIKAGVPLLQSFEIVANGHSNPAVSKLLYSIKSEVEQGSSLSQAFEKYPDYFDVLFCNLIAAGEKAGILDTIMDRLAEYLEKIENIKGKIKSAMVYPIAVMAIAFIVTAVLMIFVVPVFKEVFEGFGAELPPPTLIVMNISDTFVNYWWAMLGVIVGFIYGFKYMLKNSITFKNKFEAAILKAPIFGVIFQKTSVARWARTLATMFAAGVPLVEALGSVASASGNYVYYTATKNAQRKVETGQSLTVSLTEQNLFPNMMIQMTQIGEESGSLDVMLNKVAEFYENEVDDAVASMSSLIEPLIISFLGVVIGGLVVAMYLPIFKMGTVV